MLFRLSTITRSTSKNVALVRQMQSIARLTTSTQPLIQSNKCQQQSNLFEAAKLDTKLIKPYSTNVQATPADHENHSKLWTLERGLSAALIAIWPLAFITPNPYLDYALALSLVVHIHWGVEAIVVDYIRPRIFGPIIPKISMGLVYLLSILTLVGLYQFNYSDVGLSQAITMFLKK